MYDGFWTAVFTSNTGDSGGGVAVLKNGRIVGGDGQFTYVGAYSTGAEIQADITCEQHRQQPGQQSVFGPITRFHLKLKGSVVSGKMTLAGHMVEHPQATITMQLTKKADF